MPIISHCRVCDSSALIPAVDLGLQPLANLFLKKEECGQEPFYPLCVVQCSHCQTAQLNYTVPKEEIYSRHTYLTGMTRTLDLHFRHVAEEIDRHFFSHKTQKSAFDIGSNDGTQLAHFKKLGYDILGVEAADQIAEIARQKGIPTLTAFFNHQVALSLSQRFDVINAAGVFFHLEELHSVTEGIQHLLKPTGIFVIQFLYIKSIQENGAFDQIYHEHLLYYSLQTLNALLQQHGLCLIDAWFSPIHGGSMMAYATHARSASPSARLMGLMKEEEESGCNSLEAYQRLSKRMEEMKEENRETLQSKKDAGKCIYGLGAPVKGNTLLNYFGIGKNLLDCLVEKNPLRKGLFSPGQHLPIYLEEDLSEMPDVYYVLAWNFREEILKRHQHLIDKGVEFIFPVIAKSKNLCAHSLQVVQAS